MSQLQHGGFRGKSKRGRYSPYSRGGGGGSGQPLYRKVRKNNGSGKGSSDVSFQEAVGEMALHGEMSSHNTELPHPPPSSKTPEAVKKDLSRGEHDLATPLTGWLTDSGSGPLASGHTSQTSGHGTGPEGQAGNTKEKKYSVKARLFVGNLPKETHQEVVKKMFEEFGEVKEVFVQREKNFGFIRMVRKIMLIWLPLYRL